MRRVSISELKARLSRYLRIVRQGGEVQILDRGVPVARLVGLHCFPADDRRFERLVHSGVLRPGSGDTAWILDEQPLSLPQADLSGALGAEREDRA